MYEEEEEEEEEGNVRTYRILGSLESLAIKKNSLKTNLIQPTLCVDWAHNTLNEVSSLLLILRRFL